MSDRPLDPLVSINEPHVFAHGSLTPNSLNEPATLPDPPVIESIDPDTAEAGSADLVMTVTGTGFTENSTVLLGAVPLEQASGPTETLLSATVQPSLAVAGPMNVTVNNGAQASNQMEFIFTEPP